MTLRLAELTPENLGPVMKMPLKPGQERFVAPVVESIAEAYARWSLEQGPFLALAATPAPVPVSGTGTPPRTLASLSPFFESSDVPQRASPVRTGEVVGARAV